MPRARLAGPRFVPLAPTSMRCSRPRLDCAPRSLLDADGLGVKRGAAAQRRASFLDFLAHFWRACAAYGVVEPFPPETRRSTEPKVRGSNPLGYGAGACKQQLLGGRRCRTP